MLDVTIVALYDWIKLYPDLAAILDRVRREVNWAPK